MTIGFHVKVFVTVAKDNWTSPDVITRELASEIKSNLESIHCLPGDCSLEDISAEVTMIGREVKP